MWLVSSMWSVKNTTKIKCPCGTICSGSMMLTVPLGTPKYNDERQLIKIQCYLTQSLQGASGTFKLHRFQ